MCKYLPLLVGLIVFGISVPLVLGKVPPNKWYGIRIPASFASESNWYRINRFGGWHLMLWSFMLILIGISQFFFAFERSRLESWLFMLSPMILIIPAMYVIIYASIKYPSS